MKRICSLALTLILILGLAGCAQKAPEGLTWQEQYDLGIKYLEEGNYEEAIIAFTSAIEIEPIHRVLFNVDCATVLLSLITWSDANMAGCCFCGSKKQPFTLAGPHMANVLSFEDPTEPLTVGTIDDFISDYIERHPEAKVDYVHDEPAVRALCKQGAVAFLMPPFAKSDLFRGVVMGGVLPRKTFSMGHAEEKRYYIECRKITE